MRLPSARQTEASAVESAAPHVDPSARGSLERFYGPLRVVCGALLFGLVVAATVRSWSEVRGTISRLEPYELILAEALVLVGLVFSVLTWRRGLLEIGSKVRFEAASKIYLLGQLGKYLPGSVWALAAQTELAKSAGVPRSRGLTASIVAIGVNVVVGIALGLVLLGAHAGGGAWRTAGLVCLVLACAVVLSPPVLTRLVNTGLRMLRRPTLAHDVSWGGICSASGWSLASALSYGASVWILAVSVGAPAVESLPLCLAGVPLAMTAGFLVFVAPSGIGVREAVLVATLAPVLDRPDALAVALIARLVFTLADLVAAALVIPLRFRPSEAV